MCVCVGGGGRVGVGASPPDPSTESATATTNKFLKLRSRWTLAIIMYAFILRVCTNGDD